VFWCRKILTSRGSGSSVVQLRYGPKEGELERFDLDKQMKLGVMYVTTVSVDKVHGVLALSSKWRQ
jgi:hypothetical protein